MANQFCTDAKAPNRILQNKIQNPSCLFSQKCEAYSTLGNPLAKQTIPTNGPKGKAYKLPTDTNHIPDASTGELSGNDNTIRLKVQEEAWVPPRPAPPYSTPGAPANAAGRQGSSQDDRDLEAAVPLPLAQRHTHKTQT